MNREDIIRMEREIQQWKSLYEATIKMLANNFAIQSQPVLLAEKESYEAGRMQGIKEGATAEREACAKACEELLGWYEDDPGSSAANAIRARGQA